MCGDRCWWCGSLPQINHCTGNLTLDLTSCRERGCWYCATGAYSQPSLSPHVLMRQNFINLHTVPHNDNFCKFMKNKKIGNNNNNNYNNIIIIILNTVFSKKKTVFVAIGFVFHSSLKPMTWNKLFYFLWNTCDIHTLHYIIIHVCELNTKMPNCGFEAPIMSYLSFVGDKFTDQIHVHACTLKLLWVTAVVCDYI